MTIPDPIDRIITQGRVLVRAIEALGTIEPSGPLQAPPAASVSSGIQTAAEQHYASGTCLRQGGG